MSKPTPQVGQTLYSLNIGNAARNCEQKLKPVIVRKVGRKYFECSTKWLDERERGLIIGEIRALFDWRGNVSLSLDKLRQIRQIIKS